MDTSGQPSRRQVLRLGVVAVAAAAAPVSLAAPVLAGPKASRLSRSMFTPHVGGTFTMVTPDLSHQVVLSSVGDLPHSRPGDPYRFRLLFTASRPGPEQGTYTFRRASLTQALFVVPVGSGRSHYEAIVVS